jgi:adenylosuccinate lyase
MLLERTLDDSANRRVYIPELFLSVDTILKSANTILEGLVINELQIKKNLSAYGPFSAMEAILMEASKKGADRQAMHEHLRELSMKAWQQVQETGTNTLESLLAKDKTITSYIKASELLTVLEPKNHIGLATNYCDVLLKKLHDATK